MCTCTYTYTHVCVRAPRSTTFARRIKGVRVCSHANPHTHDNVWAERVCALAHSHSFMSDIRVLCPCTPPQCSCAWRAAAGLYVYTLSFCRQTVTKGPVHGKIPGGRPWTANLLMQDSGSMGPTEWLSNVMPPQPHHEVGAPPTSDAFPPGLACGRMDMESP
jgi:hypothetical protein